ncbi:MAG: glycosyltransferase family 4 protein [Methylococcales bacterium]
MTECDHGNPRLRVLFIGLHFSEESWNLVKALAERTEVCAILNRDNFAAEMGFVPSSSPHEHLKLIFLPHRPNPLVFLQNAAKLVSTCARFRPDIIHCHENGKDYLMIAMPWLLRYPFVLTVFDPKPHSGSDSKTRASRHGRYLAFMRRKCDAAIVHGEAIRSDLAEILGPSRPIFSVMLGPLGIDEPVAAREIRVPFVPELLFFGRIEAYKGLGIFIEAVRLPARSGLRVRGVVAGRGRDLENHRQSIANDPHFLLCEEFIPRHKTIELFDRASVVVVPYLDGTQSGVAALAMGRHRAVVASNVGSIRDLVLEGRSGLLVPPGDAVALAEALQTILESASLQANLEAGAQALAEGELSWRNLACQTTDVYLDVLERDVRKQKKKK